MKSKKKSKVSKLTFDQIEAMTQKAENRRDIPMISSKQVNMRLSPQLLSKAKKIAEAQGTPVTTFLVSLLKEDIERLWKVFVA